MKQIDKIIWIIFSIIIFTVGINIIGNIFDVALLQVDTYKNFLMLLPVLLLVIHAARTLNIYRATLLIFIASFTGFVFEFYGLKYGTLFGGHYIYAVETLKFMTVPINVILYWAVFIYTGYVVTNSFLYNLGKNKPSLKNKNLKLLPLLIVVDALIVVAIDLFMDPVQVAQGNWSWPNGGPYFGIPIGNFVGWIVITIISTGIVRSYEYFHPTISNAHKSLLMIPVLGYGLLYLTFFSQAIDLDLISVALLGTVTMLPIFVGSLYTYVKRRYI
ncbi:hypothetical protein COY14_00820 [Candidatus Roizmanbacteria bacterium CG_4_10_14_0_2_um_filter_36_9]|uniref:Carotenoid biosynthesis protein n=1 Tax=Candidatus Roizmanbacteria bacterium CG_4_10_14_0_2_um_filter_36_9 TaxID=1974823 RepID=A0A2M7U5G1_9BACT|nr:MAG: hypothetical protein COY14_00820 [Candidatus Roizmanbacteria bacterium CG_4_10_14_0_2_um_filter_36_9]